MPITSESFDAVLLASAARTAQTDAAVQENPGARGVIIILDVTAASGTGGLSVQLCVVDPLNQSVSIMGPATTAVITTGKRGYVFYPAASLAVGNLIPTGGAQAIPLPQSWLARVAVGDASSYTYSLSYSYLF